MEVDVTCKTYLDLLQLIYLFITESLRKHYSAAKLYFQHDGALQNYANPYKMRGRKRDHPT